MQPELLQDLLELCRRGGYEPVALANIGPSADLTTPVLEQSILLRESGAVELSLAFLDRAEAGGLTSGWIQDNRARALLLLQRRDEAKELWLELAQVLDEGLRNVASEQLEQLKVEERIPELWSQFQRLAEENSWTFKYLPAEKFSYFAFQRAVLEEVILIREKGQVQLSLSFIELTLKAGFRSPWLRDNQARCLLNSENVLEACRIWRELEASSDLSDLKSAAAAMLHACRRDEKRALLAEQEKLWIDRARKLHQTEDLSSAVMELINGWIDFPESKKIEEYLLEFLAQRRTKEDTNWSELSPWLQRSELSLEANEALLGAVEQKLNV